MHICAISNADVCPRQALGILHKALVDQQPETGRVCYPVCQFRCLLAETGTGMRVLGKGLLVVNEDSQLQPSLSYVSFLCMAP